MKRIMLIISMLMITAMMVACNSQSVEEVAEGKNEILNEYVDVIKDSSDELSSGTNATNKEYEDIREDSVADDVDSEICPQLLNWHIVYDEGNRKAVGRVYNRDGFEDYSLVKTSTISNIYTDFDKEVVFIQTRNTLYECKFSECDYDIMDKNSECIPDYEKIKAISTTGEKQIKN